MGRKIGQLDFYDIVPYWLCGPSLGVLTTRPKVPGARGMLASAPSAGGTDRGVHPLVHFRAACRRHMASPELIIPCQIDDIVPYWFSGPP